MAKAVKRPIIQSDSEDSDFDAQEQGASFLQSSAKRPKSSAQSSGSGSSSDSNSDAEWTMGSKSQPGGAGVKKMATGSTKKGHSGGGKIMVQRKSAPKKSLPSSSGSSEDEDSEDNDEEEEESRALFGSSSEGSSSDSDTSSEQFDDGLDADLLGDEEDQKKLNEMNETERESEMYKRFEKRESLKARFEIEKKLRRQKKHDKKKQKAAKQKHSVRHKRSKQQDNSKSQAMDEYKAKRSADKIRKAEVEKERKEPLKAADVFTSESEETSSEESDSTQDDSDDEGGGKSLSGLRDSAPQYVSTGYELGKVRLSRYRLEKWVHMPFFSDAILGCFVRIGIGAHEGRMVYRICEIIGVQETPKVYSIGSTKTNKGLKLRHGIQERIFRMEYVSNSQFSDIEFHKWKVEMDKRGLKLPTSDFIRRKVKKLEEVKNVSLKEEDVEKMIQEKQRFKKNPTNYAMTKNRLIREKETAEEAGDADKTKALVDKLSELEERADLLDKQRTKGLSAISYINERNRHINVTRAEMALKAEMAEGGKGDDPFTRRKCQPTLVTLAVQRDTATTELMQQLKDANTSTKSPDEMAEAPNGQDRLSSGLNSDQLTATPVPPKQLDDLFSAHNFDIQIDLPSGGDESSTPKVLPRSGSTVKQGGPKRSLNLSDYKKRRGLI